MKKKVGVVLIVSMFALCLVALAGCGKSEREGTALKWAYEDLNELAKKDKIVDVDYVSKLDQLNVTVKSYGDPDKVFKVLNKDIKGKDIGILYFHGYYGSSIDDKADILKHIGNLKCKSIMALGLAKSYYESTDHSWVNVLPKVNALYTESCEPFKKYDSVTKQKLADVKKLWLKDTIYDGIEVFSGLEELSIEAVVEEYDDRVSSDTIMNTQFTTPRSTMPATKKNGETVKPVEPYRDTFIFNHGVYAVDNLKRLKKIHKLSKLTIAPTFEKYDIDGYGASYIFAISNVRNDIMVNEPKQKISDNKYIKIDELVNLNSHLIEGSREATVNQFISSDLKGNYKKAKKFKLKKGTPKLKDKAVVYKISPYEANYSTKKKYYDNGSIQTKKDLGNSIKTPERADDYRYFVYVYPVYKYYGKYDKGTKAYTETYYIQVSDMKKKRTYKPIKVATAKPEKKITYSGSIPKKHSGTVKESKIYKAIKKLAK